MAFAKGGAGKGAAGGVDDLGTSPKTAEYSSFAADIDLIAGSLASQPGCCRGVMCSDAGAGTKKLVLVNADGTSVSVDCTNLVGVFIPGAYRTITGTSTTIGRVLVFY